MANKNYQIGLLHLVHLLIGADGVTDSKEQQALLRIKHLEGIDNVDFQAFQDSIMTKKEREIYQEGISMINSCTDEEKMNAFIHLYRLAEADGNVHVREVRLLLYSTKMTGVEFSDVIERARALPY